MIRNWEQRILNILFFFCRAKNKGILFIGPNLEGLYVFHLDWPMCTSKRWVLFHRCLFAVLDRTGWGSWKKDQYPLTDFVVASLKQRWFHTHSKNRTNTLDKKKTKCPLHVTLQFRTRHWTRQSTRNYARCCIPVHIDARTQERPRRRPLLDLGMATTTSTMITLTTKTVTTTTPPLWHDDDHKTTTTWRRLCGCDE